MSGTVLPNAFQSPNDYVDIGAELLTGEEFKCLMFAARHILGWQDKINQRRGVISVTMFERGYGEYAGTGLSRHAILKALEWLTKSNLLVKLDETAKGQRYELSEAPDWDCLRNRRDLELKKNRERTSNARKTRADKLDVLVSETNQTQVSGTNQQAVSPTHQQVVSGTNQERLVGLTKAGELDTLNQKHFQNQSQNQKEGNALPPAFASMVDEISDRRAVQPIDNDTVAQMQGSMIIQAYEAMHRGYNVPQKVTLNQTTRRIAAEIGKEYTLDELRAVLREALERGAIIPFNFLQEKLGQARLGGNKPASVRGAGIKPAPAEDTNDSPLIRKIHGIGDRHADSSADSSARNQPRGKGLLGFDTPATTGEPTAAK